MDEIPGFLHDGTPKLEFRLSGVLGEPVKFTAIVDTGFSGFVCMPIMQAFPLGLPLVGSTTVTLADGKSQDKLTALGRAHCGADVREGVIILEPNSSEILIGMDFLRSFERALFLTSASLVLIDESEFERYAAQAGQSVTPKERDGGEGNT